jgi:hypothetical protein
MFSNLRTGGWWLAIPVALIVAAALCTQGADRAGGSVIISHSAKGE